jgi:hypothetical protein
MYQIENGATGTFRRATADEERAIVQHREQFSNCDGTQIRDNGDQTLPFARPKLRCTHCERNFTVPVRLT